MMSNQEENKKKNKDKNEMEHNHLPEGPSRVLESQEINDIEHDVMKGDTVGETLYSGKWILNTLISLSKVYEDGWTESMENDLCTLWDMTAEKDIVEFLLDIDFFKMAEFTLKISEKPRLTEIIVGIIGNMCCETKSLEALVNANELVSVILSLISSDDKETLIQVLRILRAAMWYIQKNSQSLWIKKIEECEILGEAISFILKSSTSDELLAPTIDFVYLISDIELLSGDNFLHGIFDIDQLIFALCESMIELINQKDNCHTEAQLKNIENWLNIIFNIMKKNLLRFSDNESDENFMKITAVLLRILQPYETLNNLMPSEEKCLLCIQQCIKMVFSFQQNEMLPNMELIQTILTIMINLNIAAASENEFENSDDFKQVYDYIANYWIETLKIISKDQILEIFRLSDHETVNNILEITDSLSKIPEKYTAKLLQAKSMIFSK